MPVAERKATIDNLYGGAMRGIRWRSLRKICLMATNASRDASSMLDFHEALPFLKSFLWLRHPGWQSNLGHPQCRLSLRERMGGRMPCAERKATMFRVIELVIFCP